MSANRPAGCCESFIGMHGPPLPPRYCPSCGYDVMANLRGDSVRCPECGGKSTRAQLLVVPPPHPAVRVAVRGVELLAQTAAMVIIALVSAYGIGAMVAVGLQVLQNLATT